MVNLDNIGIYLKFGFAIVLILLLVFRRFVISIFNTSERNRTTEPLFDREKTPVAYWFFVILIVTYLLFSAIKDLKLI